MSEDRFAGIEEKLDVLVAGQTALQAGQTAITAGQATLQAGLATVEAGQRALEARQQSLETRQGSLEAGQTRIEARLDKVEITQEAMRDEIKQIAEGHAATQVAIERGAQVVCDHIDKRIGPIEDMVRIHFGTTS